eukprot:297214_1
MAEFEDMFHEVRININNGILTMQYRKGKCKGKISWNILLEYDSEEGCISKWFENLDSVKIYEEDKLGDCNNSMKKFIAKLNRKCGFDNDTKEPALV